MDIKAIQGYKKVGYRNFSACISDFYNFSTGHELSIQTDDIEYTYGFEMGYSSRLVTRKEADYIQSMPVDKEAEILYKKLKEEETRILLESKDIPYIGSKVEVYKGRKVPKGTVSIITGFQDYKDCYGRVQTCYAIIETKNGELVKTNELNCRLIK